MEHYLSSRYRIGTFALIAIVTSFRLAYLAFYCPLDLAPDEAYYWDWSRQLDWSYHSKGPLVAWLIRLSCTCFGDTMFAVRLPAVLCGSLLLLGLFTLVRQIYQSDKLAFVVTALALTLPIVAAGALLMTIDAPFTCAWLWALVFAHRAISEPTRWAWPAAGLCILVGLLAKHTMVLWVPSFALFLATTPALREHFRRPGFWIMTGIGALGGVPVLVWNAANGWVTLRHTQIHVGAETESLIHWLGPFRYLGAQFGILLGFWFVAWAVAMWRHRPTQETRIEFRFLWWMSMPTFVFFGLFSVKNGGGEANWPIAAYLSGMVLASSGLQSAVSGQQSGIGWLPKGVRFGTIGFAALGLLVSVTLHEPAILQPKSRRAVSMRSTSRNSR